MTKQITVDGIDYAPVTPNGNRAIVVIDRGWIYAGDITEENGRIYLDRAVWIFRWESIGFDGVIKNPDSDKVTIKKLSNRIDIPKEAELYRVPVNDSWGL